MVTERVDRVESKRLLVEFFETDESDPERQQLRDRLVRDYLPLVHHLAHKMAHRSEILQDVIQVGSIGLINAIDRFDPRRGLEFSTFAVPTITGEIRRYFRDTGWTLHVPRRAQELQTSIRDAEGALTQQLGRAPMLAELAADLGVAAELVLEAKDVAATRTLASTDSLTTDDEGAVPAQIATEEDGYERAEMRTMLRPALRALPPREQKILILRFYDECTQAEIARIVGISQMQVSRLISRSLDAMRDGLATAGKLSPA